MRSVAFPIGESIISIIHWLTREKGKAMSRRVYIYDGKRFEIDVANKRCVKVTFQNVHGFAGISLAGLVLRPFAWIVSGVTLDGVDIKNDLFVSQRGIGAGTVCETFPKALDELCDALIAKQTHALMEDFSSDADELTARTLESEIVNALDRLTEEG